MVEFPASTVAEDFAYFADEVRFLLLRRLDSEVDAATAPSNHSPKFYLDEAALGIGVSTMLSVVEEAL